MSTQLTKISKLLVVGIVLASLVIMSVSTAFATHNHLRQGGTPTHQQLRSAPNHIR